MHNMQIGGSCDFCGAVAGNPHKSTCPTQIKQPARIPHRQFCSLCHRAYAIDWHVPDATFKAALHHTMWNSLVCLNCFIHFADEKLIAWEVDIQLHPTSLRTQLGIITAHHTKSS